MRVIAAAILLGAVLAPARAPASDNDEEPPYMIYIDPETGKYTTSDPQAHRPTDYDPQASGARPALADQRGKVSAPAAAARMEPSGVLVAAALLLLTAAGAAWRFRRRRGGRALGGP